LYDPLFTKADLSALEEGEDWKSYVNPDSLQVLVSCRVEPVLSAAKPGDRYQFERQGYFCVEPDSTSQKLVFNRTVTLKDTWAKIEQTLNNDKL
jgi:glutaminyl-tRNA synthetase